MDMHSGRADWHPHQPRKIIYHIHLHTHPKYSDWPYRATLCCDSACHYQKTKAVDGRLFKKKRLTIRSTGPWRYVAKGPPFHSGPLATYRHLIRNLPQPTATGPRSAAISRQKRQISEENRGQDVRFGDLQARLTQSLGRG